MEHISLQQGDITRATVDVIVNAANPAMLGGGGVDGAIHAAAGPALLAACRQVPAIDGVRCPFGEARITPAGNLPARYVIHTAGPVYAREPNPKAVLASSYTRSLQLALDNQCQSIAFPAISCGVYGYPLEEAAEVALASCNRREFKALDIRFYLFGDTAYQLWTRVYQRMQD